ncbi:MAG: GTP cyclohydrolase II [Acidobacteria bacterium]|nr:GTP cyclohydrolase II [Acidobacteriota bacterium]
MRFAEVPRAALPTRFGEFTIYGFRDEDTGEEAVALVAGEIRPDSAILVRIHSQCLTGDVFASRRCDCQDQLYAALELIAGSGVGVLVYQQQEGRGIGLINKIRAYELQDQGLDTVAANEELGFQPDERQYEFSAEILKYLGASRVRLLSNNPDKVKGLESAGIVVEERLPLEIPPDASTRYYLEAKKRRLGHILTGV